MRDTPSGGGACCPQHSDEITHLKVGVRGIVIGMMGLETVFQQLYALGRQPDEAADDELVGMARKFNYISASPTVEADYAVALRGAYARFYARQKTEHDTGR